MNYIHHIDEVKPIKPNGKTVIYMLGYGGRIWHARRQISLLKSEGYTLLVMDFVNVLKTRDPQPLIDLMSEVEKEIIDRHLLTVDVILVGISMGGLVGFNLLKRHKALTKLLVITGGNMARVPGALKQKWELSYDQLLEAWSDVNIYTPIGALKNKRIIMVLPSKDRIINPNEVAEEIGRHTEFNRIRLIRTPGGHFRTIITETILNPRKIVALIDELESG